MNGRRSRVVKLSYERIKIALKSASNQLQAIQNKHVTCITTRRTNEGYMLEGLYFLLNTNHVLLR